MYYSQIYEQIMCITVAAKDGHRGADEWQQTPVQGIGAYRYGRWYLSYFEFLSQ